MIRKAITGAEAGVGPDEQIDIALRTMEQNNGFASITDIIEALENKMDGRILSHQGIVNLRYFLNEKAKKNKWVLAIPNQKDVWQITSQGQIHLHNLQPIHENLPNEFSHRVHFNFKVEEDTGVEAEEVLSENSYTPSNFESGNRSIEKPYNPSKINVISKTLTIFQVMRKIEYGEILLQPDFQRLIVWDNIRQSRLIESILLKIPLPFFYVDAHDPEKWIVIDGLQRLYTLKKFINENKLQLTNLDILDDLQLEGKLYKELPRNFQRDIEETDLHFYIVQPGTPDRVKFTIFSRVNTGGLVLQPQEIRHAIFQGPSTRLLQEISESAIFQQVTLGSIDPKRMDDRECILRFFAFHLKNYQTYTEPDLNGFLSEVMSDINTFSLDKQKELRNNCIDALQKAHLVFGPYAFRKMYKLYDRRNPINKALFEVWTTLLHPYSQNQLIMAKDAIVKGFIDILITDAEFEKAISQGTGSVSRVKRRFSIIENLLREVVQ